MKHFADRLIAATEQKRSVVVVGLDPKLDSLPPELREKAARSRADAAEAIVEFNRRVLLAVAEHAVAVKPQSAFYEALGWEGVRACEQTVRMAREMGLLVILDVKRGDIGTTAEAYAQGHLDLSDADAVTLNPYIGTDSVAPFLQRVPNGKGVFILVKTSNPSSGELQDLQTDGVPLYEKVAALVERWGSKNRGETGFSAVGAVVGATYPGAARRLRELMPHAVFLVPGYGAQGATAEDCRPCFDSRGRGAVVNSSRGIIFAYARPGQAPAAPWEAAVSEAARRMKEELEQIRYGAPRI